MNKLIVTLATALACVCAGNARAANRDSVCVSLGSLAQTMQNARRDGTTEETVLGWVDADDKSAKGTKKIIIAQVRAAVKWVFMMPASVDVRYLVYAKCVAGDFDSY